MTQQDYRRRIAEAEALRSHRKDYIEGYVRGIRHRYQGPKSGKLQDHETWLRFAYEIQGTNAERGRGYMDGLQGIKPRA